MNGEDVYQGLLTVEELAKSLGIDISKALDPLNPLDFVTITVRLARALNGAVAGTEAKALKAAINSLDVDWPNLSDSARAEVIRAARQEVTQMADAVTRAERVLEKSADKIVPWTRASAVKRHGLSITKDPTDWDFEMAEMLRGSQMVYIKDEYGRRVDLFDKQAKDIVAGGLERGLGRDDISERLATRLPEYQVHRSKNYWNLISTDFANKTRNASQVNAFGDAGVKRYRFSAVVDEITSSVCRMLHGKTFSVPVLAGQLKDAYSLGDPEDIKNERPWVQNGVDADGQSILYFERKGKRHVVAEIVSSGEGNRDDVGNFNQQMSDAALEKAGINCPPIHASCRSTIVTVEE